jgi:undecaprenyl-diphosphatase
LIFVSELQDGKVLPLTLNVAFHLGTLAAVLFYFWKDWLAILQVLFRKHPANAADHVSSRLLPAILIGSVPAGVIGILFKDEIEQTFHHPSMTIGPLVVMGIALWAVDKYMPSRKLIKNISYRDALVIGVTQALALIPGSSRSGSTMMGARLVGYNRIESARFSFLLGTPAMLGAALLESKHLVEASHAPEFWVGIVVAGLVGCLAINILLRLVARFGFLSFAIYRIGLAVLIYLATA